MTTRILLAAALALAACGGNAAAPSNSSTTPTGGTPVSKSGIADPAVATKMLENKLATKCLSFAVTEETPTHYDIEVREVHGADCPGDPETRPVFGRYRVQRDGAMAKENPVTSAWEPLK
jgi:hypothetical protein